MVKRDAKVLISKISREADVLDLSKSDNNTSDYRRLFPPICITNNFSHDFLENTSRNKLAASSNLS